MPETPKRDRLELRRWLAGEPLSREAALAFGLALPALMLAANMWRVHAFTVDDSFISYRYARNLAHGLGLVYNAGERVEGYTNFLFTLLLGGGIELGLDPEWFSKAIGAASAFGALVLTYAISGRLAPYRTLPCVATWLLASSIVSSGWPVFGLETSFFVALILLGTYLFLRESEPGLAAPASPGARASWAGALPWSGVAFAVAGLTRPEAPLFVGLLMVTLGRGLVSRQNLVRAALFCAPLLLHLGFRRWYYGAWLPNTAGAKLGDLGAQVPTGLAYVGDYLVYTGPVLALALLGMASGFARRRRDVLAVALDCAGVTAYVVLVGGDWMKDFRFLAPVEPFAFLLVDLGVRRAVDRRVPAVQLALGAFALFVVIPGRDRGLRDAQVDVLQTQKPFWDAAAGGTARWLLQHPRGEIALGDIGYIGWATDYPVLDLLGLVDPVIARLPGGYTQKVGPGFTDRLFVKQARYVLLISSRVDCQHPSVLGSQLLWSDARFAQQYALAGTVPLEAGFAWCVFERASLRP